MAWYNKCFKQAQFQDEVQPQIQEQQISEVPTSQEGVKQPPQEGVDQFGAESINTVHSGIQTSLASWKNGRRYYLQLMGVPADPSDTFLTSLGYKWSVKFKQWSKEVNKGNAADIEAELISIENNFKVPVFRDALNDINTIFNLSEPIIQTEEAANIQKLKEEKIDGKEKYKIAEEYVQQSLENIIKNINTPETQSFLDALTSLNDKFYKYSLLNSFLIAWQNSYTDPVTGKTVSRSGRVANKNKWEKEFGRQVKPEEMMRGSDVFVPRISTIKTSGVAVLLNAIRAFIGWKGDGGYQENIAGLYGFIKKKMPQKGQKWKKGMISSGLYAFFNEEIKINGSQFNTIRDVYNYFAGKQQEGETDESKTIEKILTGFQMGPVYDMDQTDVVPGQEHKDPKTQIEAVEQQWLGTNNTDTEKTLSIRDLAIKAASSGKILENKNIDVGLGKETGEAGGWSSGMEIQLSERIAGERQLFTLIHELAHSVLHFKDRSRKDFTRSQAEIDAEGTAYVVMGHYGFSDNQRAYNYLANWTNKQDKAEDFIRDRFKPILEAANAIIAGIEMQKMEDYGGGTVTASNWYRKIIFAHKYKQLLKEFQSSINESSLRYIELE